jgi:hypothetical protein
MPKEQKRVFTVSSEALEEVQASSEVQLGILYSVFADKEIPGKKALLSLCELYVLHSSMIAYVNLIMKDRKMEDEGSCILTTQDMRMMKTIRVGCDDLRDKLALHNIFVAVN